MRILCLALLLIAIPAAAQVSNPPDLSNVPTKAELAAAAALADQAAATAAAAQTAAANAAAAAASANSAAVKTVNGVSPVNGVVTLAIPTLTGLATQSSVDAIAAAMPQPANAIPPSEAVGGVLGSSSRYRRMDDATPRITRATTVVTVSGGTFSGTWTTPLATAPTIVMTPIAASASIDCQLTAAPTTTTFAGRCWTSQSTVLNLGIITAGLTLLPTTPTAAGVSIQVIALPPTQ